MYIHYCCLCKFLYIRNCCTRYCYNVSKNELNERKYVSVSFPRLRNVPVLESVTCLCYVCERVMFVWRMWQG